MGSLKHHVLKISRRPQYASIDEIPTKLDEPWLLSEGVKVGKKFPARTVFSFAKSHKGMKVDDFIFNLMGWLITSEKAWEVLSKEPVSFERFPVIVHDHKKRPLKASYCLAHLLGTVDCVDLKKSDYERSAMDPESILAFRRLVLDKKRIPKEPTLFRIKEYPRIMIIRSDLVERLEDAGVTGFELVELDTPVFL
jgi:hypothetical protein